MLQIATSERYIRFSKLIALTELPFEKFLFSVSSSSASEKVIKSYFITYNKLIITNHISH
jgi:hypothetical protein